MDIVNQLLGILNQQFGKNRYKIKESRIFVRREAPPIPAVLFGRSLSIYTTWYRRIGFSDPLKRFIASTTNRARRLVYPRQVRIRTTLQLPASYPITPTRSRE